MPFTKPNLQYSSIQEHIKGITFISHGSAINRGSVNFLKTAYGNPNNANLEKAAKLLASHMWSITRDTTMVLITTAILVLAEKNKEEFEEELNSISASEIQNLFVNMGSGNGAQAKTFVKSLEDLFKAILQKGKIDKNKANRV